MTPSRDMLRAMARLLALLLLLTACNRSSSTTAAHGGGSEVEPASDSAAPAIDATTPVDALVDAIADVPDAATPSVAPTDAGAGSASSKKSKPVRKVGKAGDICRCNPERREKSCVAVTCPADLICSSDCGVRGCHSHCMTSEEMERAKFNP
jgi:hypothetical protein